MPQIEVQKAIVSVYMLFAKGDTILMARRINKKYMSDHYTVPTGHVDNIIDGDKFTVESPTDAVIREGLEEAGIHINRDDIELVLTQMKPSIDGPEPRLCLYFKITNWIGNLVNTEPEYADNFDFYPLDDLPQPLMPELVSAFRAIKEKRALDEFGYR
jgi:ADP-ribose pyrophosphatase YjhB (NUDIX family)